MAIFSLLAVFSLHQFTKAEGDEGIRWSRIFVNRATIAAGSPKATRNRIHRWCGWIIVGSMLAIGLNNALHWNLMFWLEAIAVWAFGFSWIMKSDWIRRWRDDGEAPDENPQSGVVTALGPVA